MTTTPYIETSFPMPALMHRALMTATSGRDTSLAITAGLRWWATLTTSEQAAKVVGMSEDLELAAALEASQQRAEPGDDSPSVAIGELPITWTAPTRTLHTAIHAAALELIGSIRCRWRRERGGMMGTYHLLPAIWRVCGLTDDELNDAMIDAHDWLTSN